MKGYKILILTDHTNHSNENSLYAIATELANHKQCDLLDVSSRGNPLNNGFFQDGKISNLYGRTIHNKVEFDPSKSYFFDDQRKLKYADYDIVFLRLPRPITDEFFIFLKENGPGKLFVNDPIGIMTTSSKAFLMNFPNCCPEMRLCKSIDDVIYFSNEMDIVLKPLREYGGKGILKITGNELDDGHYTHDTRTYLKTIKIQLEKEGYLGMAYLKNVSKGDKRILVADGIVLASSLRMPAQDKWLCNVALGGTSVPSEVTDIEHDLIGKIAPTMRDNGILIYGVDTLENDNNDRVISEINTMSIGGFPQAEAQTGLPIINQLITIIFNYINEKFNN